MKLAILAVLFGVALCDTKKYCGTKTYDPTTQACCERYEEPYWYYNVYNVETHKCLDGKVTLKNIELCGDRQYDVTVHGCCKGTLNGSPIHRLFVLTAHLCVNGEVIDKFDKYKVTGQHDEQKDDNIVLCGRQKYDKRTFGCCKGTTEGGFVFQLFVLQAHLCVEGKVVQKYPETTAAPKKHCGTLPYDPEAMGCCERFDDPYWVYNIYPLNKLRCSKGHVVPPHVLLCGDQHYNVFYQQCCSNGNKYELYRQVSHYCLNGKVHPQYTKFCDKLDYDSRKFGCCKVLIPGGTRKMVYPLISKECRQGSIVSKANYCGDRFYPESTHACCKRIEDGVETGRVYDKKKSKCVQGEVVPL